MTYLQGLLLILLTGCLWAGLGVIGGQVARRGLRVRAFFVAAFVTQSLLAWTAADWSVIRAGRVERAGRVFLVYPLSVGVCIVGFGLYSRFLTGERFSPLRWMGLALIAIGIGAMNLT